MNLFLRWLIFIQISLASVLCYGNDIQQEQASMNPNNVTYISPLGKENWHTASSRLRCGLSLKIRNYGIAYFEQYAAKSPHFILAKWQQVERRIPARLVATPPMWKAYMRRFFIGNTSINPGEYGIYLSRNMTLKVLTYLAQGYQPQFQYRSDQGFHVTLQLSPVNFQRAYSEYQTCLGDLLDFTFEDVRHNVFLFATDNSELSDEGKTQMNRIIEYLKADSSVKQVKIEGYTDDTGRKGYNNAISEIRAKAVEGYFLSKGINKSRLSTTWYGEKFPAMENDTEAGQSFNRRVVVTLIK